MSTITRRKIRADAQLEQLNEAQQECLCFWLEENCSYFEIVRLVHQHFGLSVGKSAVGAYYRRHVLPQQQQDDAEIMAELAALPAGDFDAATLQRVRALAWSAVARPQPDIDRVAKLMAIVMKAEQHALAVKKLELEERKVAVKEKLAALRAAAVERRSVVTRETRPTMGASLAVENEKRGAPEQLSGSAGVVGRSEDTEVAAKAQRCEGRSEGPEAASGVVVAVAPAPLGAGPRATIPQPERGEILCGMTPEEVVRVWGMPHGKGSELRNYERSDFWDYRSEAGEQRVCFERGRVSSWSGSGSSSEKTPALAAPSGGS